MEYLQCALVAVSVEMTEVQKRHETELARLKNASEEELLKVQQENYVLSTVRCHSVLIHLSIIL